MAVNPQDFRIKPGHKAQLGDLETRSTPGWDPDDKAGARRETLNLNQRLEALQEKLYAEGTHRVLVVLQAMDAAGKDGTIRHVFDGVNPSGVKVAPFKKPSSSELARDYLWRIHSQVPANGQITIFNRSHYEDVLVVRVLGLVPEQRWRKRYGHIRAFEEMLVDEGTTIVKIYLHISPDEQAERLQARLDEPDKNWKFDPADLAARSQWKEYRSAFEDAIVETSTEASPWFVIPADRKWYRNLAISQLMVDTLESLNMSYPEPAPRLNEIVIEEVPES